MVVNSRRDGPFYCYVCGGKIDGEPSFEEAGPHELLEPHCDEHSSEKE